MSVRARCADCGAPFDGDRKQVHDGSCPVGQDLEKSSAADRDYFEQHPRTDSFVRELTWGESVSVKVVVGEPPAGWRLSGPVLVRQLAPGVRVRDYSRLVAAPSGLAG